MNGIVYVGNPTPNKLTQLEFLDRFTQEEIITIRQEAKISPVVDAWLYRFELAGDVNVTDPRTIEGVRWLEAEGHLAEGRSDEILAVR